MADSNQPVYKQFGTPEQQDYAGWKWEFAGVPMTTPPAPMYTTQDRMTNYAYFGGDKKNVSPEMTYPPTRLT